MTVADLRRTRSGTSPQRWWKARGAIIAYAFIAPYVVLFLAFRIGPAIFGTFLSLAEYGLAGDITFVGLDNFARLFDDPIFWNALKVTVLYTVIAIPLTVAISIGMAVLCNRTLRGMSAYRAVFFLPVVTSSVMSGIVWVWILGEEGPLNWLLTSVGLPAVPWLNHDIVVLVSLAAVSAWTHFGYDMLILLAGMLAIPSEYYEAAEVDGANAWDRFRHITLPLLKPALFFVIVLEIIRSFQVFDTIYVMTGGGPVRSSYSLTFMIYDQGFGYFEFGYASAAGVVLLVITLAVSLVQRRLMRGGTT
ncbi:carbohydrate ABC transporter permease [Jiangella alba]|uniref:Carbohydrate ABC transporter membrane protein 1, CUT1 family n=1 Tax=Jiangella alba TaxID=561176 RepID=A0A1H5PYR1_9ACTN|nr:sugar ABC transporter permease [Jiangella alba]SEF18839.1 carbohydrate ABC transporter membrane protein 1, CUT1 family [Jiangella alba]